MQGKFKAVIATGALCVGIAGASGGSALASTSSAHSRSASQAKGSMTVTFGTGPVADFGQYYIAQAKGYFKHQGLTIKPTPVLNGPEGISAVKSGKLDVAYSATLPLFLADQSGLGLKYIGPGDVESAGHWQYYMLVKRGSSLTTLRKVFAKGNKIGWIGSSTPNAIAVRLLMRKMHINSQNVTFVTLPVPNITTALGSGEVNAAIPLEPFTTMALQAKTGQKVGGPLDTVMGKVVPTGGFVTSPSWASSHRAAVTALDKAMAQATVFIKRHPATAQQIIGKALKLPAAVVKAAPPLDFRSQLPLSAVQSEINQARSVGLLSKSLNAKTLFVR